MKDGSEETKAALANEEISINQAYHDTLDRMNGRKAAADQNENAASTSDDDTPVSQEERLRRVEELKKIRMELFPDEILYAIEKAVDFELKSYPSVRYSDAELASIKNIVMEKIDDILKRLAC